MLAYLTAGDPANISLRVTAVKYDAGNDTYDKEWSKTKGTVTWVSGCAGTLTWPSPPAPGGSF